MEQDPMMHPVVVGVDGSAAALRACEYASLFAGELGSGLRLVHVYRPLDEATGDVSFAEAAAKNDGYRILREAAQYIRRRTVAPLDVVLRQGKASRELAEAARPARLVVVGRRPLPEDADPRPSGLVLGLVPVVSCPVVVVPADATRDRKQSAIVVGIAESGHSEEALRFAFAEAARNKAAVRLVRAWPIDGPEGRGPWFMRDQEATEVLDEAVADLVDAFPDVPVERVVESGRPVDVLGEHASNAALVVVGDVSHEHGVPGAVGDVTRQLVARSDVPVAVVRHQTRQRPPRADARSDARSALRR